MLNLLYYCSSCVVLLRNASRQLQLPMHTYVQYMYFLQNTILRYIDVLYSICVVFRPSLHDLTLISSMYVLYIIMTVSMQDIL